jgi:hypothetical protein
METNTELRRLFLRRASYVRHYGHEDPRTVAAGIAELDARIAIAEQKLGEQKLGALRAERVGLTAIAIENGAEGYGDDDGAAA